MVWHRPGLTRKALKRICQAPRSFNLASILANSVIGNFSSIHGAPISATPGIMNQSVREALVDADRAGQRLDNFLLRELGSAPRSLVYRLIRTGQVRVNGGRAKPMRKLVVGDRVRIPPVQRGVGPVPVPDQQIDGIRHCIVHRGQHYLVVDKPAGMASQAGSGLAWGLSDVVAAIEPRALPVHRLDRETSGLMLFALGSANARHLQQLFRDKAIGKRYLALLEGHLPDRRMTVDQPLKKIRDASGQHRMIVAEDGQPARSQFRLLERSGSHDFVEVTLETGRTHQIRAHAAHLGAPLVGDDRYNPGSCAGPGRMFLHAAVLELPWPVEQVFSSPLPEPLAAFLEQVR